jgi:cytochrome c-type biogenesis protein CcmH
VINALLLAVALLAPSPAAQTAVQDSTTLDARTREVASQLRCVVCQGLSIEDSPSELAQSMRAVVREQLAAGRTEEEIKAYFVERYGERILLSPRATGFNLSVYILPVLAFLFGAAGIVVMVRPWSRIGSDASTVPPDDPDLAPWEELVPRP